MTEGELSTENLSVAMTTDDVIQSTNETDEYYYYYEYGQYTSSSVDLVDFYFHYAVIAIGVVGTAANGLILYALLASKQHKKHVLIFNQNVLDTFSSFWLIVTHAIQMSKGYQYLSGWRDYWLCVFILTDEFIWWGIIGSKLNLMSISIERYLKIVHPVRSQKWLREWVLYSAAAFAWIGSIAFNMTAKLLTVAVIDGVCWPLGNSILAVWFFAAFSAVPLAVMAFCYGRILSVVRRQARVMAGHSSTSAQGHSNQIQTNVIKVMIYVTVFFAGANFPVDLYMLIANFILSYPLLNCQFSVLHVFCWTTNSFSCDRRPIFAVTNNFPRDFKFLTANFIPLMDYYAYYVLTIVAFFYISINPFIYATKFDPVKSVLLGLVPCKKSSVAPAAEPVATGLTPGPSGRVAKTK